MLHFLVSRFYPATQFPDALQTLRRQVLPLGHQANDISKHQEILALERPKRVLFKKRNDDLAQMLQLSHSITHSVAVIGPDDAAAKKGADAVQNLYVADVLNDDELWQHLHTKRHFRMAGHSDVETAFTIRKTDDPLCIQIHAELKPEHQVSEGFPAKPESSLRIVPLSN